MLIQTSHLDFDNQIEEHESKLLKYKDKFKLEKIIDGLDSPWSLSFIDK